MLKYLKVDCGHILQYKKVADYICRSYRHRCEGCPLHDSYDDVCGNLMGAYPDPGVDIRKSIKTVQEFADDHSNDSDFITAMLTRKGGRRHAKR